MKYVLTGLIFLQTVGFAVYEVLELDNEYVNVVHVTMLPKQETILHRDVYPHVVIANRGGVVTRIEADGTTNDVEFPTGVAVFRPADPPDVLHSTVNNTPEPIELTVIQIKPECPECQMVSS